MLAYHTHHAKPTCLRHVNVKIVKCIRLPVFGGIWCSVVKCISTTNLKD
nr:MAG TPA: hypothetical protein [Bacteriophage sp.]